MAENKQPIEDSEMQINGDVMQELHRLRTLEGISPSEKLPLLRSILERVCRAETEDLPLNFADLRARMTYLITTNDLEPDLGRDLHQTRINANHFLHKGVMVDEAEFARNLSAVEHFAVEVMGVEPVSDEEPATPPPIESSKGEEVVRTAPASTLEQPSWPDQLTGTLLRAEPNALVVSVDMPGGSLDLNVRIHVPDKNDRFQGLDALPLGTSLSLVDLKWDSPTEATPLFIIAWPDYLVDATALARCFQEYGVTQDYAFVDLVDRTPTNRHILFGGLVNRMFDAVINEGEQVRNALDLVTEDFKANSIRYALCHELENKVAEYARDAEQHHAHLRATRTTDFVNQELPLHQVLVEPTYISPLYGLQGRLDAAMTDESATHIIELKSGKPPWDVLKHKIKYEHRTQLANYFLLLQSVQEVDFLELTNKIKGYILYSKKEQERLLPDQPHISDMQRILNIRNHVVHDLVRLASGEIKASEQLQRIRSQGKVRIAGNPKYDRMIEESFLRLTQRFVDMRSVVQSYFDCFMRFAIREQWTARLGNLGQQGQLNGYSGLWRDSIKEKRDQYAIITNLRLAGTEMGVGGMTDARFARDTDQDGFSSLREGDACVLYANVNGTPDPRRTRLIKVNLIKLEPDSLSITFRHPQQSLEQSEGTTFSLEKDYMDTGFGHMLRNLSDFVDAEEGFQDRILGLGADPSAETPTYKIGETSQLKENQRFQAERLANANPYFLLWGPPGTGKTSRVMSAAVEAIHTQGNERMILLAYTNRAVDEICEMLLKLHEASDGAIDFCRLGRPLSCHEKFKPWLLESKVGALAGPGERLKRGQIVELLEGCRIFVGTMTTANAYLDLWEHLEMDMAIIDEASQLLEPQVVGLLSRVRRFAMIGDHRQLPAVVIQGEAADMVPDDLRDLGMMSTAESLFERLYERARDQGWSHVYGELNQQGRMDKQICDLAAALFYEGVEMDTIKQEPNAGRVLFLDCRLENQKPGLVGAPKLNATECAVVLEVVKALRATAQPEEIGIIAPFRNQVAAIREELQKLGESDITVDTVERYQGSERNHIIVSFTISEPYQLRMIASPDRSGRDRKLNVALTRARDNLILIGDQQVLRRDPNYHRMLELIAASAGVHPAGQSNMAALLSAAPAKA